MRTRALYVSVLCLAAIGLGWRAIALQSTFGRAAECEWCLAGAALAADAPFWLGWLALAWFGFHVRQPWLGRMLRVLAILGLAIYLLDVWLLESFFTRLYSNWVVIWGARPLLLLQQAAATQPWWALALAALILAWMVTVVWRQPRTPPGRPLAMLTLVLALALLPALLAGQSFYYVHAWATRNVLTANWFQGLSRPYSEAYLEAATEMFPDAAQCVAGENQRRDVIVLILESWSSHHSPMWGGQHDWTPGLDAVAREETPYLRFFAAGFNTNHGLMSLLAGTPVLASLSSPFSMRSFEPAWGWAHTLPAQLERAGYATAFLTSGNLRVTGKDEWLRHVGFDYLEGHRYKAYRKQKRTHFKAAPDALLYARAVEYWREETGDRPLAMVVESVSSHIPFVHPLTRERGEEGVIRYLDETVSAFYEALEEAAFFQAGGLLVMVSDHRTMTAVPPADFERFGPEAPARLPLIVARGEGVAGKPVTRITHQADLTPSLSALLGPQGCGFPGWRDLFAGPAEAEPRCVFHTRGDDWGLVEVYCTRGHGTVRLDGDDSEFIAAEGIESEKQDRILEEIAVLRTMAHRHTRAYLDEGL